MLKQVDYDGQYEVFPVEASSCDSNDREIDTLFFRELWPRFKFEDVAMKLDWTDTDIDYFLIETLSYLEEKDESLVSIYKKRILEEDE